MISVIVPVYKAEKYLHRCVDSILAQSYTDFELLLIEDGSPDSSGAICDEFAVTDSRVRVFHKENGGVSSARNLGLDNARGDFIAFCDADDYVGVDWLKAFYDVIDNSVDLIVQGIYYIINSEVVVKKLSFSEGYTIEDKRKLIVNLMSMGVYGYPVTKLFRRQVIEENHIRFDVNSAFREDEQFFSKYLEYAKTFKCIEKENYYYILPVAEKIYKGDSYYSLLPIFKSLDIIFDSKLPIEICQIHYVNIKDAAAINIATGKPLTKYHIDLYSRIVSRLGYKRGLRNRMLNFLIIQSPKFRQLSRIAIRLIQKSK